MRIAGIAVLSVAGLLCAQAQQEPLPADIVPMDPVVVIAHRQPRSLSQIAGTVTVAGPERLSRDLVVELQDMARYEPGLEIDGGGTRFGSGGVRIRGIGGNRTALLIDNVPAPDRFSVGNFADSGRGLMDLGLAGRMEILRGPASTIHGSKALGGVLAIYSLDPQDILLPGRHSGLRLSASGSTDSNRLRLSAGAAARSGAWSFLAAASAMKAEQPDVAGLAAAFPADTQERTQRAALLRAARESSLGRTRFSLETISDQRNTEVRALLGTGRFANTAALTGDDRGRQWRALIDHSLQTAGSIERGHLRFWRQSSNTLQETLEERPLAPAPVDLLRRFDFRQASTGAGADLESAFEAFGYLHRLGYGFEASQTGLRQLRDGLQTHRTTGAATTVLLGEAFPLRDFPLTRVQEFGLYLHDEVQIWPGGPVLSPGARFELYRLNSRTDPLFSEAFPDAAITDLNTAAWTPRIGAVWPAHDGLEWFAQAARGFRSPPFGDVNIGLDMPQLNVRAVPNPDLRPEKGATLETGLRWRTRATRLDLALFRNDYKDFIETRARIGVDPATGTLLFQSINRNRVRIEGAELRLYQNLGRQFSAEASAEGSRSRDRDSGADLSDAPPPRFIAALHYDPASDWALRLIATRTRAQRALQSTAGEPLFSPPGHTVADFIAHWSPTPDLRLSLGIFNLADRRYFLSSDVRGRAPNDPTLPLLARPGRHLVLEVSLRL